MIQNDSKMFVFSLLIAFSAKCFIKKLAMSLHIDLFGITLHYSEIRNSESKSCEAVQSHSNDNPDSFILNQFELVYVHFEFANETSFDMVHLEIDLSPFTFCTKCNFQKQKIVVENDAGYSHVGDNVMLVTL